MGVSNRSSHVAGVLFGDGNRSGMKRASDKRGDIMISLKMGSAWLAAPALAIALAVSAPASATTLYSQGFEADTSGWDTPTRVASGTDGITAASGGYYAQATTDFTRWGGYDSTTGGAPGAFQPYTTSIKIYLNVGAGTATDTRFDFSSAINKPDGTELRDFVFNVGFYDSADVTNPGAGNDRFIVTASNNAGRANANPANPARNPIAIETTGWYTFQHVFIDNGGQLEVDMSILDSSNAVVGSWVLSGDAILGVGGNRYGWFASNEFDSLAIDDTSLTTPTAATPLPATLPLLASGLTAMGFLRRRKKKAA